MPAATEIEVEDQFDALTAKREKGQWKLALTVPGDGAFVTGEIGEPFDVVLDRACDELRSRGRTPS